MPIITSLHVFYDIKSGKPQPRDELAKQQRLKKSIQRKIISALKNKSTFNCLLICGHALQLTGTSRSEHDGAHTNEMVAC